MTKDKPYSIFDGSDAVIADSFNLSGQETIDQKSTCRRILKRCYSVSVFVALIAKLYACIENNRTQRAPSSENWRLKPVDNVALHNKSPEILLERAIALLATQGHLPGWCNQIPVASGLINDSANKRTAIDLLHLTDTSAEFIELKWASNTPLFAAMEILRYGLVYLYSYLHQSDLGYDTRPLMQLEKVTLSVLAPTSYYTNYDLNTLIEGLSDALHSFSRKKTNGALSMDFTITAFPADFNLPFETGQEVTEQCAPNCDSPAVRYLIDALVHRQPVHTT